MFEIQKLKWTKKQPKGYVTFANRRGPSSKSREGRRKHKSAPKYGSVTIVEVCVLSARLPSDFFSSTEKNNFTTSGYSCAYDDNDEFCDSSDSDLNESYLQLLEEINQQRYRLKSFWKELRLAFDLLYEV